ncbi:MAG: hypothetical protein EOP11_04080 [Proteobacteria bacterium]|nr:MAG: hypothetical protein EOP11_04080 [Pseudomonadota bacterium]
MKLLSLCAAGFLSLSTIAGAATIPQIVQARINQEVAKARQPNSGLHAFTGSSCADFDGNFAGACLVDGKSTPTELTIRQIDCNNFVMGTDAVKPGENNLTIKANKEYFTTSRAAFRLSQDGQALLGNGSLTIEIPQIPSGLSANYGARLTRQGDAAHLEGSFNLWLGEQEIGSEKIVCDFQKK